MSSTEDPSLQVPRLEVLNLRVQSLQANRSVFEFVLVLEAALFPIAVEFAPSVSLWVGAFSLLGGVFSILAILAISDSLHFYTKYAEYQYMWTKAHETAYPDKKPADLSNEMMERALVADNVGYYLIRLSLLMLSYAIFSFSISLGYPLFVLCLVLATILLPLTYGHTHRKKPLIAFKDYFLMKPLFPQKNAGTSPKPNSWSKAARKYRFLFDTFVLLLGVLLGEAITKPISIWSQIYTVTWIPFGIVAILLRLFKKQWFVALRNYVAESVVWVFALVVTLLLQAGVFVLEVGSNPEANWAVFGTILFIAIIFVWAGNGLKETLRVSRR